MTSPDTISSRNQDRIAISFHEWNTNTTWKCWVQASGSLAYLFKKTVREHIKRKRWSLYERYIVRFYKCNFLRTIQVYRQAFIVYSSS